MDGVFCLLNGDQQVPSCNFVRMIWAYGVHNIMRFLSDA